MASIFTKIINGEIPGYIVAEDDQYIAILDVFPIKWGHTLVIPKQETDYIFDLDEGTYQGLFNFAQKVAKGLKTVVPCIKIGVAVIGLEVPHVHVHLVPVDTVGDMNFSNPKLKFTEQEFIKLSEEIKAAIG
ncbi:MAG TPA: HIT family protein [Bacteroidia bacterium]|nr:HIT family protein [Bacteroidia bacterium]